MYRTISYKFLLLLLCIASFNIAVAQESPAWLTQSWRTEQYPQNVFITGFAQDEKNKDETISQATERIKDIARANLSESILSSVKSINESYKESVMSGDNEAISENFKTATTVSTDLKINGIKIETFVKENMVYAFAYANKYEIIGYYKANLNMQVQQIEGFIKTAKELENNHEKVKAKDEYNKALPVFEEIATSQGILSAVDKNITEEDLKMQKTMDLYNEVAQANVRLSQAILVCINTDESLFGEKTNIIENKLKAILAEKNCSFTTEPEKADWKIEIKATSREYNYSNKVYFSYVDAEVKLYKAPSDKHVYQNEFSQKGGHSKSYQAAAQKAFNDISKPISEKILNWINN